MPANRPEKRDFYNKQVRAALAAASRSNAAALDMIKAEYPIGTAVIVHHYRGQYRGRITAHCGEFYAPHLGSLVVRNDHTGKGSKRAYYDLEVV